MPLHYKKRRELFTRQVDELLHHLGAKSDPTFNWPWPHYKLETAAGPLSLAVHNSLWLVDKPWARDNGVPWVSGRFEDLVRAEPHGVCGNGKWNHFYWHNWTDSFAQGLDLLELALRRVLPEPMRKEVA